MSYGVYVTDCPKCKWLTARKKGETSGPFRCEACGEPNLLPEHREDVACLVMTISEKRSRAVQEHAEKHGYLVLKDSSRRYSVLRTYRPVTVTYKTGKARSYMELERVFGPGLYQQAMKYLLDNTPDLPQYLTR